VGLEDAVDGVMSAAPVRAIALRSTAHRLRILGYHGIERPDVFAAQLRWLTRHLVPVALDDVVAAIAGARRLPPGATWVTFDDGDPTVVDVALPLLREHGVRATMFVCPGVIDTDRPHWWHAVDEDEIAPLKLVPDAERRAIVDARLAAGVRRRQLTIDEVRAFADHGDIGNHTWDHPMLDQCDDDEQRRQVRDAHEWLSEVLGRPPIAFAYPNGNPAPGARAELAALGYRVAVLHDHRLTGLDDPLALSRLRAGDHHSPARFEAIVSGAHPAVHAARARLRRR
jgi:peptidoglycan/xylan/chitin deacetylase (PgdA/CDA1 family)